jgi:glycolate oxidase iron-sulfur subunit
MLMRYLDKDAIAVDDGPYRHVDLCLGCLACETACPSGVQYGHLLEHTRGHQRSEVQSLSRIQRKALDWITSHAALRTFTMALRVLQRTGLDRLVRLLRLIPARLRFQLAGVPKISRPQFSRTQANLLPARSPDKSHHGVLALFTGCVMDHWYSEVHAATARVLRWNGYDVLIPKEQGCCGALHAHAGELEEAEKRLAHNRDVFHNIEAEALVVNAAGCSAQLRAGLWPNNHGLRVVDIGEWLVDQLHHPHQFRLTERTTYDAPCHLYHAQGIQGEPYRLLEFACEQLVPLPESDACCGSAGTYSLIHSQMSQQILGRKLRHVQAIKPDILTTANPGCHMQLQGGVTAAGIKTRVRYAIEVLDEAYRRDPEYCQAFNLDE